MIIIIINAIYTFRHKVDYTVEMKHMVLFLFFWNKNSYIISNPRVLTTTHSFATS